MRAAGNTAFPKKGSGGGSVPRTGMERGRRPEDRRKKMRSNVRKMWTALLAVLFAAAVGFGLWFAFAPAARPANVHAAEDGKASLEIRLDANGGTLYSNQDVNRLIGDFFIEGTVHYADGGTDDLLEFQTDGSVSFQVYADYSEGNFGEPCDDLRPNEEKQEGRDGNTYQRWIVASIELDGTTVSSEPLLVNVTRATPSDINVDLSNNVFAALNTIPPENITVEIEYEPGADYTYTVPYGEYTILYGAGPEYHDRLEFGDSEITISYREYEGQTPLTEMKRVRVTEALVVAPTWASYAGTDSPVLPYTGEKQTLSLVGYDQDAMTLSGESGFDTTITDETPEFTMTDAGEYSVTISVNEGYKFRSDIPTYAEPTYDPSDPEKITALTYKWSISPAEIIEVSVAWKWAEGWYYSQEGVEKPKDSDIEKVTIKYGNEEQVTKLPDDVGATVTFYFSGTANDGTSYGPSSTLPENAGEYSWTVSLTGMNNFEDFAGTDANGGAGSFVIEKQEVALPKLNQASFAYNAKKVTPSLKNVPENAPYGTLEVTGQENVGTYVATLYLTNPDNYEWATPEVDSGVAVDGAKATYSWEITQSTNKISNFSISGWTWGEYVLSDNAPSAQTAFRGEITYKYYTDSDLQQEITTDPSTWDAGTYYVTATSAADPSEYKNYTSETTDDAIFFTVSRAPVAKPALQNDKLLYNGEEQAPELAKKSDYYTFVVEGQKLVNADGKTYSATVTLDENHCWADEMGSASDNIAPLTLTWSIVPVKIGTTGSIAMEGWTYGDAANKYQDEVKLDSATQEIVDAGEDEITRVYTYYSVDGENKTKLDENPVNAGTYCVSVTLSAKNNANGVPNFVSVEVFSESFTIAKDSLSFTEDPKNLGWTWGKTSDFAIVDFKPEAKYGSNDEESATVSIAYYKADTEGKPTGGALTLKSASDFADLSAGSYVLVATVEEGTNYNAQSQNYLFTVEKGQAEVRIEIEKDNWTYLDDPQSHLISVTGIVGHKKLESSSYTVTYYTRGWNTSGGWTTGGTLTAVTLDNGSTVYLLPENYSAGYYYIGVSVSESSNYDGVELGYTEGGDNAFTVEKKAISIPSITRQLTYSAGTKQAPSELIDASNNQLNSYWQWASVVEFVGYATISGSATPEFTETAPSDYGSYYLRLKLTDTDNYVWQLSSEQLTDEDKITDAYYDVVYQITGTVYGIVVSAEGWTIGDTTLPVPSFSAKEGDDDILEAALNEGVTVTYSFYKLTSLEDMGGEQVKIISFEVSASNKNYELTGIPEEVANASGYYRITVNISESENHNYAETYASDTFTVSPYVLESGDVEWSVPTDLTYRGSEFTYDADGNGRDEISATYKNWTYKDGKYQEATSNLLLSLPEGVTEIKNWVEGGYTLTAELPKGETNVVWGDDMSKTHIITITKRAVDVTLQEHHETYKNKAFEPFEAKEGTDYTAAEASGDKGLISGDDLKITLTPSSDTDAGSYAWDDIAWSNGNYIVTVTNGDAKVFVIDKAPITVSIHDQSSTYGEKIADLTYTVTGTLYDNADTIFSLSTEAENISDVGEYAITGSVLEGEGSRGGNYNVTFEGSNNTEGVYTIKKRALTVTVTGSIEYGEEAPTEVSGYAVTLDGALERDEATLKGLLSISAESYSAGNNKGSYPLTVSGNESAKDSATWGNYDVTFAASTLTVTPREITVTIQDVTTTYGTMGELKVSVGRGDNKDPIYSGDLDSSVTDTSNPARYAKVFKPVLKNNVGEIVNLAATLDNGTYSIVLDDNFKNENYKITVTEGTYTVGRLGLWITLSQNLHGDETSPVYDGAAWTYSAKANYTVAGESVEIDFTGQIVYYERTLTSFAETEKKLDSAPVDAGSYWAVLPATAASGNFEPTSQFSTDFTIAQREVDVVWAADNFTYNGTDQKDDVTAGYRAYHDGAEAKGLTDLWFTVQPEFKDAGEDYIFTANFNTDLEKQNYKLIGAADDGTVSKTYRMKQASISISVDSQEVVYGEFDGSVCYKVTGLYGSDSVQVTLSYFQDGVPVTLPENVDTYIVSATIAEHQNYTLDTVTPGTLTIDPRELTVEVVGTSIEYGEDAPNVYDVTLTGALKAEEAAIKELLTFDTPEYSAGYIVGNYTVKASFGADEKGILKNYQYTVTDDAVATCTLKVTQRKITVKIADVTTDYGTAGTLSVEVTRTGKQGDAILGQDLVKEDGQVVSGIAQFANVFTLSLDGATLDRLLNVGEYTIVGAAVTTGEGAKGGNYEITFKSEDGTGTTGLYTVKPLEVEVNFEVEEHEGSENLVYDGTAWTFTATAEGVEGADGQKERVTFQVTYAASAGSSLTGGFAVNAGSYTVSVAKGDKNIVADGAVSNYIVKADQSKGFTIEKRTLTLEWVQTNVIPDEDGSGENRTSGYDSTLMELVNYTTGTGMDAPTVDADGELKVTFTASGTTTYYVQVELKDPLNYAWPENSTNVSGENGKSIQISFSVNKTTNNITFGLSGSAGSVDPVAEVFGTYGEEFKVYIAQSEGESPEGYNVVVYIDSIVKGDAKTDYYYRFARDEAGTTAATAYMLEYDLLVDGLTTAGAGTYWMQVFALTDESSDYGIGRAYVKVTIGKKTITKNEINNIKFTTEFVYNGKEQTPVAIDLPEYLKVTFSKGATNVTDGTGLGLTATFTIVGNNCEFADGAVSLTIEVTIIITPFVITEIYWDENPSFTYDGTDQSGGVFVYFVDVDGTRAKLTATTEGGFLNAGEYIFTAQVPNSNYEFKVGLERTNTITMAKASVSVVIVDQSGEYTGEEFELQTMYDIDGRWSNDTAQDLKLYEDLVKNLQLVIQEGSAVNAGKYTITLAEGYEELQNYEVNLQTGTLTITPKQLTFTWPTVTGGVYGGTNPGVTLTGNEFMGFVDGEGYTDIESLIKIVYSGTSYSGVVCEGALPTEAGSYTVTVTLGEGNYTLNAGAQAYLVARADYSFTVDINGWTYNETANAPSVNEEHPEKLTVTYTYAEVFRSGVYGEFSSTVPTNAGSYVVRAEYAQGSNYNAAVAETLFTIEKAEITVKITFKQQLTEGGNGWVYGMTPTVIYELQDGSNPGNGYVEATYSTGDWSGSAIPTEVGSYTLTVTVDETANYKSGSVSVEFEIVRASEGQLAFTVTIKDWTYGDEPNAPSVTWGGDLTGHPDGISPTYTYATAKADGETYSDEDFSSTVPKNAGSYVVRATFAQTDNYGKLSATCKFTIGKATAKIDTSGMQKSFTYNGRAQALSGAVLNHDEATLTYSPPTVTAVGSYTVTISAAESTNYTAAIATVTVTVSRASAGFSVRIDDWTYGETPNSYIISGGSGGSVSVTYSGTTNAGVKYSSSKVPTEAGEYTITVVMSASGNYSGGTARDSFTIHRAKAEAELSLAGWMYGEEPNAYVLTPEFLREEVIRAVYSDGTYYSEAVPQDVGSYTLTVTYGETDNYLGGEVSCKFSITRYDLGLSVSIEGWTYGDEPNKPVVTGADIIGLTLSYTGTANDGTMWSSNTAPEKAGSYTLTVTVIEAGSYTDESASTDFVIARRLLSAPAWDEEGMRELIEVCSGDRMTRAILGFDMSLMNAQSATAQFMFDGTGAASVTANIHGVYTIVVSLKDAANYGWADLNEGETLTGPVTLTWTLTERVISLLWFIILLVVLIVIALIVLIVLLKKGGKPDGMDTGKGDVRLSSVAPVGLLLVVAPFGEIIAAVALGVVLAAVVIADIAVGVRNAKRAKAAENAQEPVPAYGDEAAAEGEAYPGTEVPADDGAEDVPDEDGMLQ